MFGEQVKEPNTFQVGKPPVLDAAEKAELLQFSYTTTANIIFKVLEIMVIEARDEAAAVDPANEAEVRAKQGVAYTMGLLYAKFKEKVQGPALEHYGETKRILNARLAQEQEFIEDIIINQK